MDVPPHLTSDQIFRKLDFWRKAQLNHFLHTLRDTPPPRAQHTPFEKEFLHKGPLRHGISKMYSILTAREHNTPPRYWEQWEADLDLTLTPTDRNRLLKLTHKSSRSASSQEANYKILSRWYRTPQLLHKMYPSQTAQCWRCEEEEGNLLHILWGCRKIVPFWNAVRRQTEQITDLPIPDDPAFCLIQHQPLVTNSLWSTILPQLLLQGVAWWRCGSALPPPQLGSGSRELTPYREWSKSSCTQKDQG